MSEQPACTLCGAGGHLAAQCEWGKRLDSAFTEFRHEVASGLLEGESQAHWKAAYRHADDLISRSSFDAGVKAVLARATLAQPSPAPELERPEVVGYRSGTSGHIYGHEWGLEKPEPLMPVAQHARIVGALLAEIKDADGLSKLLGDLLREIDITIRGPEPELTRYGYPDLPVRVKTLMVERTGALARIAELEQDLATLRKDKDRLDAIEGNCWDVRYESSPNADAGDSSIGIEIIGHYQGVPHVRVLGENYTENLRAAIDQAMTAEAYPPERPEYDDHGRPVRATKSNNAETWRATNGGEGCDT